MFASSGGTAAGERGGVDVLGGVDAAGGFDSTGACDGVAGFDVVALLSAGSALNTTGGFDVREGGRDEYTAAAALLTTGGRDVRGLESVFGGALRVVAFSGRSDAGFVVPVPPLGGDFDPEPLGESLLLIGTSPRRTATAQSCRLLALRRHA
jgi:hypothetical protein